MTRDELALQFALVLLRNSAMQDMTPVAIRERAYEYADAFLQEPEEDDDDGARAAPPPRREWRVVPGPNAKLCHLTTCPTREAAIMVLDHARARGDVEAVMERWQEGWVREEPTREASRCEPPADLQPASRSTKPPWRVQWRRAGRYCDEILEARDEALFRLAGARRYDKEALFAFSTDGGATWRAEVIGTLPEPPPRWRLLRWIAGQCGATRLGVFATHAEAMLAFSRAAVGGGDELVLECTDDGGCTWVKVTAFPEGVTT